MNQQINGINWVEVESMKYWSFPASYAIERKRAEVQNAIFSGDYYGALKVDGYYQRLVKDEDGNCFMIARNKGVNGIINKYDWVPQLHPFMESLPNGSVLLCECYLPGHEGSKNITSLLGCLKDKCIERQNKGQKLHFYIFDICAWNGVNLDKWKAVDRFTQLANLARESKYQNEYIEWAKYFTGQQLWIKLQEYLAAGREGMVITRKDCPIYFKRTPAHMTIKIKKELQESVDVVVMGANPPTRLYTGKDLMNWRLWENIFTGEKIEGAFYNDYQNGLPIEPVTKTYFNGWAGSLVIGMKKGDKYEVVGSLSGLTEEVLSDWQNYKGKVAEITAMEIMETGGFRHPRLLLWRDDLTPADTDWYRWFSE